MGQNAKIVVNSIGGEKGGFSFNRGAFAWGNGKVFWRLLMTVVVVRRKSVMLLLASQKGVCVL